MGSAKEIIEYFRSYRHVADFQRFCGVETYRTNEHDKAGESENHCECDKEDNGFVNGTNGTITGDHSRLRNGGGLKNGFKNAIYNADGLEEKIAYRINNKLIHLMFEFGSGLGSEMFYIIFFPFMTWNVDSRLTRQILLIWYPLMYFGQFLKDWIKWPRPGPPAVRLEGNRFEMEYGMPSTHTIVGTCIPFSLLVLTSKYYEV